MRIRYNVTVDDMVAFSVYFAKNSKYMKRTRRMVYLVVPGVLLVFFCAIGAASGDWVGPIIFPIIAGVWFLQGQSRWFKRYGESMRKIYAEGKNKLALGEHEMVLGEDGLFNRNEYGEVKAAWAAVERVGFSPDYIFIFISALSGYVVPRRKVLEVNYEEFAEELKRHMQGAAEEAGGKADAMERIVVTSEEFSVEDKKAGAHCGLGILSFATGAFMGTLALLLIFGGILFAATMPESPGTTAVMLAAFGMLVVFLVSPIGLLLGILGLRKRNRKQVFSVLGVVLNAMIFLGTALLIVICMILK